MLKIVEPVCVYSEGIIAMLPRMKEMENWKAGRGKRGPYPRKVCPKERARRLKIASYYVLDRVPLWVISQLFGISVPTASRWINEALRYPEEDAGRLRAELLRQQNEIRN